MLPKLLSKVAGQHVSGSPHREPALRVQLTFSICDLVRVFLALHNEHFPHC